MEDSATDFDLVLRELQKKFSLVESRRVETEAEFRRELKSGTWDIIFADYSLPTLTGLKTLEIRNEINSSIPLIIISGTVNDDVAVEALKSGANNYVLKDNLIRLNPAVERELREAQNRRERESAQSDLTQSRQELESLQLKHQAILRSTPHGLCILSSNFMIMWANRALGQILGEGHAPDRDLTGLAFKSFFATDQEFHHYRRAAMDSIRQDGTDLRQLLLRSLDGGSLWCEVSLVRLDPTQTAPGFVVSLTNIDGQKKAQEDLRRQFHRLSALRAIDMAITASLDLRVTLNVILDQVTMQLGVDAADVLLLNPSTKMLDLTAGRGFQAEELIRGHFRLGSGLSGQAALLRRNIQVADLHAHKDDPERREMFAREKFVAYLGLPLIAKGQVKGVLELFHRAPLDPDPDWVEFMEALAGQAAIAVDNASLFDDLQQDNTKLSFAYESTLEGWARTLDARNRRPVGHSQKLSHLAMQLAREVGLPDTDLITIRRGALLHDVGMLGVPEPILFKAEPLTTAEKEAIARHPALAFEWLSPVLYLRSALDIPHAHHEKWDGSGYPRGLGGEAIPLAARIFAVVDVWLALQSDRPDRKAWTEKQAREYLLAEKGKQFDPRIVDSFFNLPL
ncbi:GAF domain-containing protein [Candidatus Sumerlaeota bacterium]|nr:GAF domain-containing protein [Candidatus Sumerlaeota bacterium]